MCCVRGCPPHNRNRIESFYSDWLFIQQMHDQKVCEELALMWPEPYPAEFSAKLDELSAPFQTLATHYDLPHINIHWLITRGMLGMPGSRSHIMDEQKANNKWELLSRFYEVRSGIVLLMAIWFYLDVHIIVFYVQDWHHPSTTSGGQPDGKGGVGTLLIADALVGWLYKVCLIWKMSDRMLCSPS